MTRSPTSLPSCQVVLAVSPVAPYNPNVPPPPNPYTRPGHGGGAARTPVRSSRAAVALHFLLGLGVMLFLVPAVVLFPSGLMGGLLSRAVLVGLVVLGPVLAFGRRRRTDRALGRGLLAGTPAGAAVAVLLWP
ncbi:hypothetical protein [Thermobifida alba]|uniref:hypothetical protein n=1 Tax=Thermobifida alba TaxID=53522 RepID=UPI0020BE4726|nr:hypothetical protein [Thermobifida alba]